uniref:Uncharacterized protein n=1 Tax=Lygus hesperus TaxID=30085 RepID=A0A0K8S6E0_LYGHE
MPGEIEGLKFEKLAEFIVNHEEFAPCLPLLRDAFKALSVADYKIELVKQRFIKHYEENRISNTTPPLTEQCDGNSSVQSTPPIARSDEEPIKKKKKKRKKVKSELVVERDHEMADKHDELSLQPTSGQAVSSMDTEDLKSEVKDEKPVDIILNTVVKSDPFEHSCSSSEASVSNRVPPVTPRKRRNSELFTSLCDSAKPPQPALRVIPSALLMENPSQHEGEPAETPVAADISHSQEDIGVPSGDAGRLPECVDSEDTSHSLHFEFDRNVDRIVPLTEVAIINAVKKDMSLRGRWITVGNMKRSGNVVSGYIKFPDEDSCFKTLRKGLRWNGFQARLTSFHEVEYRRSFADDTTSTHPEPSSFERTSINPEDEFWSPVDTREPFLDGRLPRSTVERSPQSRERRYSQPRQDTSTPQSRGRRFSQPRGATSTPQSRERRFSQPRDDTSIPQSGDGRFSQLRDDTSSPQSLDLRVSPQLPLSKRDKREARKILIHLGRGRGRGRGRGLQHAGGRGGARGSQCRGGRGSVRAK